MSELGDDFREWREYKQHKRANNRDNSAALLTAKNIPFVSHNNGAHLIVASKIGVFDFWPGTGRWISRNTGSKGFGVKNLLAHIKE